MKKGSKGSKAEWMYSFIPLWNQKGFKRSSMGSTPGFPVEKINGLC